MYSPLGCRAAPRGETTLGFVSGSARHQSERWGGDDNGYRWPELSVISPRYFNRSAHPSGGLGEDPKGIPSNILPYMMQVASGRLETLEVDGGDWETHCVAMERLQDEVGIRALNLGTGVGVSVLELIATFEGVSGVAVPTRLLRGSLVMWRCSSQTPGRWRRRGGGGPVLTWMRCVRTRGGSRAGIVANTQT